MISFKYQDREWATESYGGIKGSHQPFRVFDPGTGQKLFDESVIVGPTQGYLARFINNDRVAVPSLEKDIHPAIDKYLEKLAKKDK